LATFWHALDIRTETTALTLHFHKCTLSTGHNWLEKHPKTTIIILQVESSPISFTIKSNFTIFYLTEILKNELINKVQKQFTTVKEGHTICRFTDRKR